MRSLEEIKEILRDLKPELDRKYKIKEIGIFGSWVKPFLNLTLAK